MDIQNPVGFRDKFHIFTSGVVGPVAQGATTAPIQFATIGANTQNFTSVTSSQFRVAPNSVWLIYILFSGNAVAMTAGNMLQIAFGGGAVQGSVVYNADTTATKQPNQMLPCNLEVDATGLFTVTLSNFLGQPVTVNSITIVGRRIA